MDAYSRCSVSSRPLPGRCVGIAKGLYRSRWGNYDLVAGDGIFTFSEGLVGADLLASRLQGQDVQRSGFYDVVRDRLGWSQLAAEIPLPVDLQASLR